MPHLLTPPDWLAWQQLTGEIVRPEEWAVLRDMDAAHTAALRSELADQQAAQAERARDRHSKTGVRR